MSVTIVVCSKPGCGRMLNGETCKWIKPERKPHHGINRAATAPRPYCDEHAALIEGQRRGLRPKVQP